MNCPHCKLHGVRRSRRQTIGDFLFSLLGVYPWRCKNCNGRFHARMMSINETLHAHCPICGNHDLKRISGDYVTSPSAFLWRALRIPAWRCEPCRHKYFSILPLQDHPSQERLPFTAAD